MKKNRFDRELAKRLGENKKLFERQFVPDALSSFAGEVGMNLFLVLLMLSFLMVLVSFWIRGGELLLLSKRMLLI